MIVVASEAKTEGLTKFIFSAPSWWQSLILILIISSAIGVAGRFLANLPWMSLAVSVPAILAFFLTPPLVNIVSKERLTLNRSGLLALACLLFSIFWMIFGVFISLEAAFTLALGFIFAIRLLVLVAIADCRTSRMVVPASIQTVAGVCVGTYVFDITYLIPASLSVLVFAFCAILFIYLFDRPLRKSHGISSLEFINAFLAHLTNGSKALEEYFRTIGEEVTVPETSFFFQRDGKKDTLFVVPNLHPGPLSEIGGGNFPKHLYDLFSEKEDVFISHGCACHDFNLVSESESEKIADAINKTRKELVYSNLASRPVRTSYGTVSVLSQRFGNSILMVTTRSPHMTEDLDYTIGAVIMSAGQCWYDNVGFVDGHNCMVEVTSVITLASQTGNEYVTAAKDAMHRLKDEEMGEFSIGVSQKILPFTREQGFGDMGVCVLVTEAFNKKSAYVLFDGNNVHTGVREVLLEAVLSCGVDEAEIMTTDSHVVNMISGRNPVGMAVPASEIIPHLKETTLLAISDLSLAKASAATGVCENVMVFGSSRTTQLSSTVNAMVTNLAPLAAMLIILAVVFSLLIFMFIS